MIKSDGQLLREIALKSQNSYIEFYNRHTRELHRFVLYRIKNPDIADDILQDFWLKLWDNPAFIKYGEQENARSYICQYLRFRIADVFRSSAYTHIAIENESEWYYNIPSEMELKDTISLIQEVISNLPPLTQKTFWLRISDYSVEETAEKLSISIQSVYNKYSMSVTMIRNHIKKNIRN